MESKSLYRSYIYVPARGKQKQAKFQVPIYNRIDHYSIETQTLVIPDSGNDIILYNEDDVIKTFHSFVLNPLVEEKFWQPLCVEDRLKIIKACDARNLWLLAVIEGIEVNNNTFVPSYNIDDQPSVVISGRNGIEQKLREVFKRKWLKNIVEINSHPKRSLISAKTDDRIPALPIYGLSRVQLIEFFNTCFFQDANKENVRSMMKSKTFNGLWTFPLLNCQIVPYELLTRKLKSPSLISQFIVDPESLHVEEEAKKQPKTNKSLSIIYVLQVAVLMKIEEYHELYGKPLVLKDEPFVYSIGPEKMQYYDTFQKFYIYHSELSDLF